MRRLFGRRICLLLAEGFAVGALVNSGVGLVGAYQDLIQGAVVFALAVVCALMDGALNTLVCIAIHNVSSFKNGFADSMARCRKTIQETFSFVAFSFSP